MSKSTTIAAIIPTFNRASMLRECIDSILAQTRSPDEVIVVNDGSTDDTESVVRSYGNRVKLISKENGGKSSALNVALAQCTADYIWICDDDDIAAPDGLEVLAEALDNNHEYGFAIGTFNIFYDDTDGRHFIPPTYWKREEEPNIKINFLEEMFTFQFAMLVRRSLYQEAGPFHEALVRSEDYDMTLQLLQCAKVIYVPKVIFFQRRHSGVRGSANQFFSINENEQRWLRYDQRIFARIGRTWKLEEFTPSFAAAWSKQAALRAALLERACVLGKRALWDLAIADLKQAAALATSPPTTDETNLAEVIIRSSLPWRVLSTNKTWINELHSIYKLKPYGHDIILALCRPFLWQTQWLLKIGNFRAAFKVLFLLYRILGLSGASRRFALTLFG